MTMNETEDTAQSGTWAVEPPRKTGCGRKALRIALIVAAVGAAAAGAVVVFGRKIKEDFQSNISGVISRPIHVETVGQAGDIIAVPLSGNQVDE